MNISILYYVVFVGGVLIGFVIGGKLGFLSGQSWEIKFYRNARIKGQVVEE